MELYFSIVDKIVIDQSTPGKNRKISMNHCIRCTQDYKHFPELYKCT